jgi:hypothetical protein
LGGFAEALVSAFVTHLTFGDIIPQIEGTRCHGEARATPLTVAEAAIAPDVFLKR